MCKKQSLTQATVNIYNTMAQILICVLHDHNPVGDRYSKDDSTVQLISTVTGTSTSTALVL